MWIRNPPFQMIRGATLPDGVHLAETWSMSEGKIRANISAEHILPLFDGFFDRCATREMLFLFMDVPCTLEEEPTPMEQLHRNVYYLDGCSREQLRELLHSPAGELLIQDGMTQFGVGSLESPFELGKYKYNQFLAYAASDRMEPLSQVFCTLGIPQVPQIVSAWQLFSPQTPGMCKSIQVEGKNVYDLIRQLQPLGLYLAKQEED